MAELKIYRNNVKFQKLTNTFSVNGRGVRFGTKHSLENEKTGNIVEFDFSHSTGSEWDTSTKWIYKSVNGHILEIGNEDVTKSQANDYLRAKLRN